MASRRCVTSALRGLSSAVRPATSVLASAARPYALRPAVQQHQLRVPVQSGASIHRRWYSSENDDEGLFGSRQWNFEEIKEHLEKKGKDGDNIIIVDVREPVELFETGKIPGAINIPITSAVQSFHVEKEDFEEMYGFERPPKTAELLFYCKAGVRARAAATLAKTAGWKKVGEYPGSWLDWQKQNGPVEKVEQK